MPWALEPENIRTLHFCRQQPGISPLPLIIYSTSMIYQRPIAGIFAVLSGAFDWWSKLSLPRMHGKRWHKLCGSPAQASAMLSHDLVCMLLHICVNRAPAVTNQG